MNGRLEYDGHSSDTEAELLSKLDELRYSVDHLELRIQNVQALYERAGASVRHDAGADVETIRDLRAEADKLLNVVRGSALFGGYAADAEAHRRSASIWRALACVALMATAGLQVFLAIGPPQLSGLELVAPAIPLLLFFTYASIESSNHRSRELDRRRISLRMTAIESYTQSRGTTGKSATAMQELLDKFIEQHFIRPDLDTNELMVVGATGGGPFRWRTWRRGGRREAAG